MKGVAVLCITIHNLCQIKDWGFVECNESTYKTDRIVEFNNHLFSFHPNLLGDIFSFWLFYGVPVFIFLSGYGMEYKYGGGHIANMRLRLLFGNYVKFAVLVFPAYFVYVLLNSVLGHCSYSFCSILTQLTFTNVLFLGVVEIAPMSYWYFAATLQLYLIYYFFLHKHSNTNLIIWTLVTLTIQILFLYNLDSPFCENALRYIRHIFVGWFPYFALGIYWHRIKSPLKGEYVESKLSHLIKFFVSLVLLYFCAQNKYTWLLTPIFAILLTNDLAEIIKGNHNLKRFFLFCGKYSACVFVLGPLIRFFVFRILKHVDNMAVFYLSLIVYVCVCLLTAVLYNRFVNMIKAKCGI